MFKKRLYIMFAVVLVGLSAMIAPFAYKPQKTNAEVIYSKNLCDIDLGLNSAFIKADVDYILTKEFDDRFSSTIPISISANTYFTLSSYFIDKTSVSTNLSFWFVYSDNSLEFSGLLYSANNTVARTFIFQKDIIGMRFYLSNAELDGAYIKFKNFQIEYGSVATDYIPYYSYESLFDNTNIDNQLDCFSFELTNLQYASLPAFNSSYGFSFEGNNYTPLSRKTLYDIEFSVFDVCKYENGSYIPIFTYYSSSLLAVSHTTGKIVGVGNTFENPMYIIDFDYVQLSCSVFRSKYIDLTTLPTYICCKIQATEFGFYQLNSSSLSLNLSNHYTASSFSLLSSFDNGLSTLISDSYSDGYSLGHTDGYSSGLTSGENNQTTALSFIPNILGAVGSFFVVVFGGVTLFGISLWQILLSILGVVLVVFFLKFIT